MLIKLCVGLLLLAMLAVYLFTPDIAPLGDVTRIITGGMR